MVSRTVTIGLVVGIVVIGAFMYFGFSALSVQQDNERLCDDAQKKINAIAEDPSIPRDKKDKDVQDIIAKSVDELRKRQFQCSLPFFVPKYNEPAVPENRP
ncbi:MAG: hypothetical protein HYU02_03435 [Thaumarchaeota archaeon]|nr:hypothetical protein [Nitrososphaerota archaeon]